MRKDPNDDRELQYELLDLDLDAPLAAVRGALQGWMKSHRRQLNLLPRAQDAAKQLQSARTRAGIDIWFYPAEPDLPAAAPAGSLALEEFCRVPVAEPGELPCDLLADGGEATLPEAAAIEFDDIPSFDTLQSIRLSPVWEPREAHGGS